MSPNKNLLTVALAQIAPVLLDREATLAKVVNRIQAAAHQGAELVAFGEALVPGYPFWVERADGARFNSAIQKEFFALYSQQAVQLEAGHLDTVIRSARDNSIAVILGIIERPPERGGHSLYASLVYIDKSGTIQSVHRKLMPTYDERLTWSPGDGHGLRTHPLGVFTVGGLNCWENWMPLARAALHAQGEDLHVAIWPGGDTLTRDITRFMAREGRSYVLSVSGVMHRDMIPTDFPHRDLIYTNSSSWLANGGSCVAAPGGEWLVEPVTEREDLVLATLDHSQVREERHNCDASGHYARPDVLKLSLDRRRQAPLVDEAELEV